MTSEIWQRAEQKARQINYGSFAIYCTVSGGKVVNYRIPEKDVVENVNIADVERRNKTIE